VRVSIRGSSGAGKTTLARAVGERTGIPWHDLDEFHWLPGWRERDADEKNALIAEAVAGESWAISGNYRGTGGELVLASATHVVWLDYSYPVALNRLLRRTFRRSFTGELCCNGNRESIYRSLFSRDSILWWQATTFRRRRRQCDAFMADPTLAHVERHRFRHPREAEAWLAGLHPVE